MDQIRICPSCGKPLGADVPMGFCPECLIQAGFPTGTETQSDPPTMFVPPPVEELARLFPQLEIIELAGKGGMGAVYKVRQKQLNRLVALKILPPGVGDQPAFAERFTREAQALAQLNHPGIVTLYEFGETNGQFYFLMEFVDGVTLRQLLQRGRVSAREALAIVPQLCDALQYAHDQGVVHRDIKPENIMLDRRGRVKVTDFGLAKLMAGESARSAILRPGGSPVENPNEPGRRPALRTGAGKVMGTPQYMAPEQANHPADVDHRADIYALGVVFYQMLTGELPGKKIEPPSKKVQVDVRLDEIVLRALEQKPELRYQQASVLKTELETVGAAASGPAKSGMEGGRLSAAADLNLNREGEKRRPKQNEQFRWLKFGARVALVVLAICGVAAIILFATVMVLRHRALAAHPLKLAEDPWKLKTLHTFQVIQAGLDELKSPWPWMELQERTRSNKLGADEATLLVTGLTGCLQREHPNGYNLPFDQLGDLLNQLASQHLIAETNVLVLLKAFASSPVCDALPRIRAGQSSVELFCHVHNYWDNRLMGFQMLNELGHITIDGQPASVRDLWKVPKTSADQRRELNTADLAPGLHMVRCEVESDFQKESDLAGLDQNAGSDEWPLSKHRWTRVSETPLMVCAKDSVMVSLTNDPAINPTNGARISVKTIIIRPAGKQLSAVAAFANPAPKRGVALSVAVTLRLPGQSIVLGGLTAFQNADGQTRMTGDGILKGNLDSLSPDIKEADIVLTPEPTAVESWPGVDRIWGKEIVLSHIPLTRQDLAR